MNSKLIYELNSNEYWKTKIDEIQNFLKTDLNKQAKETKIVIKKYCFIFKNEKNKIVNIFDFKKGRFLK